MKTLFLLTFIVFGMTANATNYYISSSGDDTNNGTSTLTPWKTLNKLNSYFNSLNPGDNVLFNRGDTFYGNILVKKSGTSGSPITIGAYGSGAAPVITGFTTVSSWTNLGSNIWESTNAVSALGTCDMVVINGVNTQMGRYPNTGYLTYQSAVSNTSITSSSLNSAITNWAGAEAVIRKNNYATDRCLITNHSGTKLTYNNLGTAENGTANFGYFIQNDVRTLDVQNEWYFNSSTKKIRIYSTASPTNVQVTTVGNLIYNNGYDYIIVDGINFTGANYAALAFSSSSDYCTVQNCSVSFAGSYGIDMNGVSGTVNNNIVNDCGSALIFKGGSGGTVTNNTVRNSGIVEGQPYLQSQSDGIYLYGNNTLVQYNNIKNTSCYGIQLSSQCTTATISNNLVDSSSLILNDVGGIYVTGPAVNRVISNNIVLNTLGNPNGSPTGLYAEGIYLDEYTTNTTVTGNTIYGCKNSGIKLHYASNNIIKDNTVFNNTNYQIYFQNDLNTPTISGNVIKNNIFFSKASTQWTLGFVSVTNDIANFGTADNNYYARPMDDNNSFTTYQSNTGYVNRNLAGWQSFTSQDANSRKSYKTITNIGDLRFEYNATMSSKTIALDANYIDVKGINYQGIITLAPYSSAILIKNGPIVNQPPKSNAGGDQSITLPVNSLNLSGSGTSNGGVVTSYLWTKISGPAAGTITNNNSASPTLTGLVQGVYKYELKVTDNNGAVGRDTMQLTVNAAAILPTVANAGGNQNITLPVNTIDLSGSRTSNGGVVTSYVWTKISGPAAGTITNNNSASPTLTGLVQGVYKYELKVTDNNGVVGKRYNAINGKCGCYSATRC